MDKPDKLETKAERDAGLEAALWEYLDHFNAGDVEGVCRFFAKDCVNIPPIGPELRGIEEVRKYYTVTFRDAQPRISDYRFEYELFEGRAVVRESWVVRLTGPDGEKRISKGRSQWYGLRPGGQWSILWILARLEPR